uniref:Olfactory receptor n=1 Tax=Pelodiscus sinensis TaxID=13735 RepID=K7EZB5_PELSI|nr:olfactory receptor 14J1-like [Pelodiscus sinensis]XP_014433821.1 olfactory receptor 14J1-like [Pelodiscus sinensis]|eukprot:XP_014433820.1 olfactory receptor 14J1-like [Pelodiscus sinensis]
MSNQTSMADFLLLGFSDVWQLQILHFVVFLLLYLAALVANLFIITVITLDRQLHTPMYFFLLHLAFIDLCYISVPIPKSMVNSLTNTRSISYSGCITQVFLFLFFAVAELSILTIMAYDRYVAICQPLRYQTIMHRRACAQILIGAWLSSILYSALHTGNTFGSNFCGGHAVAHFFCEIPQLLKLACINTYYREVGAIAFSVCLTLSCFVFIIVSYVRIFTTVLRIPSEQGRRKAFSTCLPHLTVVTLFFCALVFAYLKPTSSSTSRLDLMVTILYCVVPPLVNPIIYSMRNKEIKAAMRKVIGRSLYS